MVELISDRQTVDDIAAVAGTIRYEILTRLGHRAHRRYEGGFSPEPIRFRIGNIHGYAVGASASGPETEGDRAHEDTCCGCGRRRQASRSWKWILKDRCRRGAGRDQGHRHLPHG